MKYPKISILVPAYNEEKVIRKTLNHLVKEVKYPNKEIIVGNDGSTDRTKEIAEEFAKKYPKIVFVDSSHRLGVAGRMNRLLKKASGEIIVKNDAEMHFHDPAHALFNVAETFQDPEIGGLACFSEDFSKTGEINKSFITRGEVFANKIISEFRKQYYPIKGSSKYPVSLHIFRKKIIPSLPDYKDIVHDDCEFAYRILKAGYKIAHRNDIQVYFFGIVSTTKALFLQKRKGSIGWIKIKDKYGVNMKEYYVGIIFYFLKNLGKYKFEDIIAFSLWCCVFFVARVAAEFHKKEKVTKIWVKPERKLVK